MAAVNSESNSVGFLDGSAGSKKDFLVEKPRYRLRFHGPSLILAQQWEEIWVTAHCRMREIQVFRPRPTIYSTDTC